MEKTMENPNYRELTDVFGEALSISNVLAETDPEAYMAFKDLIIDMRTVLGLHLGRYENISEAEKNPNNIQYQEHKLKEFDAELNEYYANLKLQDETDYYDDDVKSFITCVRKSTSLITNNETRDDFIELVKGISELGLKIDKKIRYVAAYVNNENVHWKEDGDHSVEAMPRKLILDEVRKQLDKTKLTRATTEMKAFEDTATLILRGKLSAAVTEFLGRLIRNNHLAVNADNAEAAQSALEKFAIDKNIEKLHETFVHYTLIDGRMSLDELKVIVSSFEVKAA